MADKAPVEGKVWAATVGTGAGAIASGFTVWLLGVIIWGAPFTAAGATTAVASVPGPVTGMVGLLITVGGAFLGGYTAKHTPRPQPEVDGRPTRHEAVGVPGEPDRGDVAVSIRDPRDLDGDGRDDTTGRFV